MNDTSKNAQYAPLANAEANPAPGAGIQVSNEQFLRDVFGGDYMLAHVTAFTESPDKLDPNNRAQSARCWAGGWYSDKVRTLDAHSNTYFTISLFEPSVEDGIKKARRRKALHRVTCCIVVDDVGTKVPRDVVTLPPSWQLETSPGNCQVGYILAGAGETDRVRVEGLVNAMVAKGLAVQGNDPGMKGVTRYVRLPVGSNRKSAYLERFGANGYPCQMREYEPERKYTVSEIAGAFGISGEDVSRHVDRDDFKPARHDAVVGCDPVLNAFAAIGAYKHTLSDGWHDVTCCKVYEHTDSADNGAAVRVNDDGSYGYRCHHRHGGEMKFPQVLEWFEREHPELGLSAAVPSRSSPADAMEFADLVAVDRDKRDYILGMIEMAESEGIAPAELLDMVKAQLPLLQHAQVMVDEVLARLSGKTGGTPEKLAEDLGVEVKTPERHPTVLDWSSMPEDPPEIPFVIPGWMPDKVVTLFAAHGGTGKSYMSVYIALCLATGRHPFDPDQAIPRTRVVLYSAEDNIDVMHLRFARYMRKLNIARADLVGWLHVLDATESDNVLFAGEEKVNGRTTARFKWLAKLVKRTDAKVLIFDNASDAIDANENDRAKVRQFMSHLKQLAPAVLLLSHVDAASSMAEVGEAKGYSGSTGWHNSARSRWFMARVKDSDEIVLTLPKVNYAKAGAEAVIKWNDGLKLFDVVTVRQGRARAEDHRDILLDLLNQAIKQGRRVSPKQNSSNSVFNTLKSMEGMPGGLKSADVMKEVNRWLGEGFVKVDTYLMSNRNAGECLALTEKGHEAAAGIYAPEVEL